MTRAAALAAALFLALGGCGKRAYEAAPLDPPAAAERHAARSLDDPALRDYLARHGRSMEHWPLARWELPHLTLAAFHFNPQIARARAEATAAEAAVPESALPQNPRLQLDPQYQANADAGVSPWTVRVALEFTVNTESRRDARRQATRAGAEAAALAAAQQAWQVRSAVRRQWLALYAAQASESLLAQQVEADTAQLKLVERRIQAGYAAATEAQPLRMRLADLTLARAQAAGEASAARAALAAAIGVPAAALQRVAIAHDGIRELPRPGELPQQAVERTALLNRLDLRSELARYDAAEAAVKLEVAKQYPEVALAPGYEWDQGANRWSLGVGLLLGLLHNNEPAIARAEAERSAQAARVESVQAAASADADIARARYLGAFDALAAARSAQVERKAAEQRAQRRLEGGAADRLEVAATRSEQVAAARGELSALLSAQEALGALEDALQRPLDSASAGLPVPETVSGGNPPSSRGSQREHHSATHRSPNIE